VNEYIRKFNYVQQYGGYPFDTNKKKAELFRNGLSLQLQDRLVMHRDLLFDALVSAVIDQEGLYMGVLAEQEKMRKRALSGPSEESTKGAPPKYRLIYTPSAGKSRVAPPPTQWNHHPPQLQQQQVLPQTPIQSPQPTSPCAPQQKVIIVRAPCFNCRCVGHFARQCPEPKKGKVPRFPTSMVIQQRSKIRAPISRSGRVRHTTIEDIPEGEEVFVGTFLLFRHPVIILFDSGASYYFMSSMCAKRAKVALTIAKPSYMINTPRRSSCGQTHNKRTSARVS
jgi:hypothetical protein